MKKFILAIIFTLFFNTVIINNIYAMRSDLEKSISENLILKSSEKDELKTNYKASRIYSNREHFTKNLVSVLIKPQAQTLNYTDDLVNGNFDLTANSGYAATIEWSHNSFNKLQLITGIELSLMDYKDNTILASNNISFLSEKLFGLYAGARYFLNDRWSFYGKFTLAQTHYVNFRQVNSASSPVLSRFTVPKIYLGFESMIYQSKNWKFNVDSRILALTNLSKKLANFEVSQGFGFYADLAFRYWPSSNIWMRTSFYMESLTTDVSGVGYSASQGSNTPGFGFEIGMRF